MSDRFTPLASRIRPRSLDEFVGQRHLLAPGKPLGEALRTGNVHSMVLWGPPGTGKTTLAMLVAERVSARFIALSAVFSGVKEIRTAIDQARTARQDGQRAILFVDEIHRFNKAQQDGFLPYIEDGTVTLIGATTQNPSFELNNALLSRVAVYVLRSLSDEEVVDILRRAAKIVPLAVGEQELRTLATAADGDARRALSCLELAGQLAARSEGERPLADIVAEVVTGGVRRFDKGGDDFYDQISALHKAVRGSSPDAALYWFARMIDGGCDPLYVARRVVRMASEDIGNADPRALALALDAWSVQERLGSPEGELAIAQAIVYCACAAKSNAVYKAYEAARRDVQSGGSPPVPLRLRNAPTALMKRLGASEGYRYAHDEPDGYAAGEHYFPDEMPPRRYYYPVSRGLESRIGEKLEQLRQRDAALRRRVGAQRESGDD